MRRSTAKPTSPPCRSGSEHAARRHRRDQRQARQPQKRPAAAGRRIQRIPPGLPPISTTTKVGDREVVRTRPVVRVSANLTLASTEFSASVPPFNAQKLLALAGADGVPADDQPGAEPDAEVSYVTRDLAGVLPRAKIASALPIDEIIARVRDTANWTGGTQNRYQVASLPRRRQRAARLCRRRHAAILTPASRRASCPRTSRCCPRPAAQITGGNGWNERSVTVKKGETIATILKEIGATPDEIAAIAAALGPRGRSNGLKEGQKLRILVAADGRGAAAADPRHRDGRQRDRGGRGAVRHRQIRLGRRRQHEHARSSDAGDDDEDDGKGMRLYQSIYETALRNNVPEAGDRGADPHLLLRRRLPAQGAAGRLLRRAVRRRKTRNDVMFAALTTGGEIKKYYRFQTPDDGIVDYYDETGKSAKKFLVRKPVGDRNHAIRLRRPQSSAARLFQDAHRRRLGGAARHADLRLRQRHRSTRSAGKAATANTSASATPTATRPPTAT